MAGEEKKPDVPQPKRDVRLAKVGQLNGTYVSKKKPAAKKVPAKSPPGKKR